MSAPRVSAIRMPADIPRAGLRAFQLVVAATASGGIGKEGTVPWRLPTDMKFFKDTTTAPSAKSVVGKKNAVIMGRKTWDSIPDKFRPLPDRINIVVSRSNTVAQNPEKDVFVADSLVSALELTISPQLLEKIDRVYVIGGATLYSEALDPTSRANQCLTGVILTRVSSNVECDVVVPLLESSRWSPLTQKDFHLETEPKTATDDGINMSFEKWVRNNEDEMQYLLLVKRIIEKGAHKGDRTGTGTRSVFGTQARFDLSEGKFPLLTTKRVFWRGVVEELLWFMRGDTNARHLSDKDIHIWDGNGSRKYLDSIGLTERPEMDLGPVYGFQWRHFGAAYEACDSNYDGKGVDQLKQVVETLRKNPNDRRIIISAWNPAALSEMALPPCHVMSQFYVADGKLSCMMYQRSCDMGLGVPFNIASYSLLTVLLARASGLQCGEFIHTMGDTHVYQNHVDPLLEQLQRSPRPFPYLVIKKDHEFLEDYAFEDFELLDYNPFPTIKMDMAV